MASTELSAALSVETSKEPPAISNTTRTVRLEPPNEGMIQDIEMATGEQESLPQSYASALSGKSIGTNGSNDHPVDDEEDRDISVDDIITGTCNGLPFIRFSDKAYELMEASMVRTVVLKLLVRNIGLNALTNKTYALWRLRQPFTLMDLENAYFSLDSNLMKTSSCMGSISRPSGVHVYEENSQSSVVLWAVLQALSPNRLLPRLTNLWPKPTVPGWSWNGALAEKPHGKGKKISPVGANQGVKNRVSTSSTYPKHADKSTSTPVGPRNNTQRSNIQAVKASGVETIHVPALMHDLADQEKVHELNVHDAMQRSSQPQLTTHVNHPTMNTTKMQNSQDASVGRGCKSRSYWLRRGHLVALEHASLRCDCGFPFAIHALPGSLQEISTPFSLAMKRDEVPGAVALLILSLPLLCLGTRTLMGMSSKRKKIIRQLASIQAAMDRTSNDNLSTKEMEVWTKLEDVLDHEELLWQQKSKSDWILEEDRYTKFYHSRAISRRRLNRIQALKISTGVSLKLSSSDIDPLNDAWGTVGDSVCTWVKDLDLCFPNSLLRSSRNITDNILVAQEVVHLMRIKKGKTKWMAIKVDLKKEYDRVGREFLAGSVADIGCPVNIQRIIMELVLSSSMQILWNGSLSDEFKPSRGVRQGCPLSPYLCVIHGKTRANLDQVNLVGAILDQFSTFSGHKVNSSKIRCSSLLIPRKMRRSGSLSPSVFSVPLILANLGMPLLHKRVIKSTFEFIIDKFRKKLNGWVATKLSLAGRVTLAHSTLLAIPNYFMQTIAIPKGVCDRMEQIVRRFIWGGTRNTLKAYLVNWQTCCKPPSHGGLGIHPLRAQNEAFLTKLGFTFLMKPDTLWAQIMRSEYKVNESVPLYLNAKTSSFVWKSLAHEWPYIRDNINWSVGNDPMQLTGILLTQCLEYPSSLTRDNVWNTAWGFDGPQRVCHFLWLVIRSRLMTIVERNRRGLTADPRSHTASALFSKPLMVWLHENLAKSLGVRTQQCELPLETYVWDFNLEALETKKQFSACSSPSSPRTTHWNPSPDGFLKLNTDGAVNRAKLKDSMGGVQRDMNGAWVARYSRNIGRCSGFQVELWTVLDALALAWNRGIRHLIVELDNLEAVRRLNTPAQINETMMLRRI
ncbi:hypothetical protein F3Y22_tig00110187pilonHSYRG00036 [Hibiscus syriacus]|uniref:RNase H type-1 domain-containing protein n=1 Tax=Hibiscus syriacus TaxID=106335 RepID=A0A6A3BD46_HIBSY|nr:hypothetical protein F3Y22_tig00110187pilonHSYRG00036 [Hibiscus syriacus]